MFGKPPYIKNQVSPYFWEIFFDPSHTLKPKNPRAAKAKTLISLAYQAFQMGLPFVDGGINPFSKTLARSHKDKIQKMRHGKWEKTL